MIENEIYEKILSAGLVIDHFYLLHQISKGTKPLNSKRIQGFLNLLIKKGFIQDDVITQKGLDLIGSCQPVQNKISDVIVNYQLFVIELHQKCQDKLIELTGKKQIRSRVNDKGPGYPFLCNTDDMGRILLKVINLYKLKDYILIEKALLKHIQMCHDQQSWFPVMQYYIMKDGTSKMVTEIESMDEEDDKSINEILVDPKSLF